jgi:dTDP-4-amino-4,6-dideoxygalactose transaminase
MDSLIMNNVQIPYLSLKLINELHAEEIREAIAKVLASGWYLRGEATASFEEQYAQFIGTRYCVACGNGLDALRLIFMGYKEMGLLHDGDEVLVPANTYIASILSITENGLKAKLVEPRLDTLEIDDRRLKSALGPHTKALLLVHLYGRSAWTPAIADFCRRHQLLLIEDNAQAHGCRQQVNGTVKRTGSLGYAAAHSFYPGKNLGALGDAGAVTTDNAQLAHIVRALGNYGSAQKYIFNYRGLNSRMDELQAAVLSVKLRYLDQENNRRRAIASYYRRHLVHSFIGLQSIEGADSVFHIFPILCPRRNALQLYLQQHGVQTMIHYPIPPHKQACYREWNDLQLPITERIHRQELSIPCNQAMTFDQVHRVTQLINEALL